MAQTDGGLDFSALYDEYFPLVSNLAFKMLANHDDCEDAVQETFLQVYRALPHYRGEASMRTWIYRIAVNACLQMIRRQSARPEMSAEDIERLIASAGTTVQFGPEDAVLLNEVLQGICDGCFIALTARLPENQRVVFVFADMLEWPIEDVAALLGVSVPSAKSRLHRARENMTRFFAPKCSHLDPVNPCTCLSRLPAAERFDPDLIRRARLRVETGNLRQKVDTHPRTLLQMVRNLPAYEGNPEAKARFFEIVDQSRVHTESRRTSRAPN